MKKILLMFVVLITSIANAQDTFNFRCISAEEQAIAAIYEATSPPTGFSDALNSASVIANSNSGHTYNESRRDFISLFDNYGLIFDNIILDGTNFVADYDNTSFSNIPFPTGNGTVDTNAGWNAWMLDIAQAIWHYGHPNYVAPTLFEEELTAIYGASTPPTELGTIINDAALAVEFGIAGNTPRKNFMESLAYFNVTVSNIFDSNSGPSEAHLSNGNVVPNIGTNANTSSMNPAQFAVFAFEVVKRFWSIGHPEAAIAAKRAERIAEIAVLSDASANVIITDYIDPDDGDTFVFNVLGDPNLQPEYNTTTYQGGVKSFGSLGTTQWSNMKSDISDKITEINDDVTERNIRINVLVQNSTTDVTVGARWSSLRGDLFDIDNGTTTVQIYANDYDLPLVVDGYTRLENLTHEEYSALDAAIALKVGDLDPTNAIYGFYPSEFAAASLQEKLDKAYDIAKANDDINAVSGSLLKGIVHGEKITLRIKAKNYPLEYLEEMANDANYEGWKTYIDRILYLVKTGDGSERTSRENHINGISNVSVTSPNNNDEDWAVAWNGALQFIYGGHDNEAHDTSYNNNNTSRRFAGYHQDNIGLLPGIIYEALLIEIDRINGYVVAADALRRHVDGGINKEREVGLKALLTGNASFHENASAEWIILNDDVTVWTNSKYGNQCEVEGYLWLGVMDVWSFRYMYIIVRNELLRNDTGVRYYNNVHQNTDCL